MILQGPSGDFNQFIQRSDGTLKYLYNPKSEFLICGNIHRLSQWKQVEETSKLFANNLYSVSYYKLCNKNLHCLMYWDW